MFRRPPSPVMPLVEKSDCIALYSAVGAEAPTVRLAEYLAEIGKTLSYPRVTANDSLQFHVANSVELLTAGFRHIPEPAKDSPTCAPDLIIAPLVAFDRNLARLGQGGGHYDAAFRRHPDAIKVGLAWSVQEAETIPMESHDVTLDIIVTECEVIQRDQVTP